MKFLTARTMCILWMIGFAGSFIIQSLFQLWFAENSYWGANQGWQNEIAIWNLGVFAMLTGALVAKAKIESYLLPGLALLSLCFAINHSAALLSDGSAMSNWAGATTNYIALLLYGLHLMGRRNSA